MNGKGDRRRPCCTSREEQELRMELAYGDIGRQEFDERMAELEEAGLVWRK